MKIKYIHLLKILIILFLSAFTKANAQDVLFREDREKSPVDSLFGANQKHYFHLFLGTGFIAGNSEGDIAVRYRNSIEFISGFKYKLKLNRFLSVGADIGYRYTKFAISQRDIIDFPDTILVTGRNTHESEKFGFHALPLGVFLRFNFDPRRGNTTGHYLELGGTGDWVFSKEYVVDDVLDDKTKRKTRFTGLPFVNPLQYHASAKIGMRWLALGVRYRFSEYFKTSYNYPQLPRFSVTAEINFVR